MAVEISGKDAVDWGFKLISLAAPVAIAWAWNVGTDVKLMKQEAEQQETAVVEKMTAIKSDYEEKIAAQKAAHDAELENMKGQLRKMDSIAQQADQNALTLAKIEVKMDTTGEKIDEIKKLLADR